MRTIIIEEDALLALASHLNGSLTINLGGTGNALQRAAQAVDAAALDVIHGERSEARQVENSHDLAANVGPTIGQGLVEVADQMETRTRLMAHKLIWDNNMDEDEGHRLFEALRLPAQPPAEEPSWHLVTWDSLDEDKPVKVRYKTFPFSAHVGLATSVSYEWITIDGFEFDVRACTLWQSSNL